MTTSQTLALWVTVIAPALSAALACIPWRRS